MKKTMLEAAFQMTKTYKEYYDAHPAIREAMCISELYPSCLIPLKPDDTFAGKLGIKLCNTMPLTHSAQVYSQIGYYINIPIMRELEEQYPDKKEQIQELIEFWKKESTFVKIRESAPDNVKNYLFQKYVGLDNEGYMRTTSGNKAPKGSGNASTSYDTRAAGIMPDFKKLIKLGIPGLYRMIDEAFAKNPKNDDFYKAAKIAVDILKNCITEYKKQAESIGLYEISEVLGRLTENPPATLKEGIQLILIYTSIAHTENFGRLDEALADLLKADITSGRLTTDGAVNLVCEFWKIFEEYGNPFDSRVMIGGIGRDNEKWADEFALIAMEATRLRHNIKPVLTLRHYEKQNPKLFDKALDLIGEGCIYPTLYNDDAYIPGCMKAMNIPYEDAISYAPLGCGEMTLEHKSIGSPNTATRYLKILEATLHNGKDAISGHLTTGAENGECESFDTFEKLEEAYFKQVSTVLKTDIQSQLHSKKITARETTMIFASLLTDDCIGRGLGLFEGGVRYFGVNNEGFGCTNVANSMAVIKKMVYEDKRYTLRELVTILDKNFENHEKDRALFLKVPKYGNNDDYVDSLKLKYEKFINEEAKRIAEEYGVDYFTVANVNPGGITAGPSIAASADGRLCGTPMALGNSPHPGTDTNGITEMLLSAAKTDPANGGVVTNMNLSRETVNSKRELIKSAFLTYFQKGGLQLNVNCFSKGDLEKALETPENYKNLIVRVSGYSARFTDLDPITQQEIIKRTLY